MDRTVLNSRAKPAQLPPDYQARLTWQCAHQIFEDTAAQAPDAIAVSSAGRQFTYREINDQAERVARFIVARGLPNESAIGVFADRSPELIAAWIGILKA